MSITKDKKIYTCKNIFFGKKKIIIMCSSILHYLLIENVNWSLFSLFPSFATSLTLLSFILYSLYVCFHSSSFHYDFSLYSLLLSSADLSLSVIKKEGWRDLSLCCLSLCWCNGKCHRSLMCFHTAKLYWRYSSKQSAKAKIKKKTNK